MDALKRYLLIIVLIVCGSAAAVYDVVLRLENDRVRSMSEHLLERIYIRALRDYYGLLTDVRFVLESGESAETLRRMQANTDMGRFLSFADQPSELVEAGDWQVTMALDELQGDISINGSGRHQPFLVLDLGLSRQQPQPRMLVRIDVINWIQHITEDLGIGDIPMYIRWQEHTIAPDPAHSRHLMMVFSDFLVPEISLYLSYAKVDSLFHQRLTAAVLALLVAIPEFILLFWLWRQYFHSRRLRLALDKSKKDLQAEKHANQARSRLLHHTSAQVQTLNQSLEEARRRMELSERLAALGEISAGIAHEINNPVAYCRSNLETLGEDLKALQDFIAAVDKLSDQLDPGSELYRQLAERYQTLALPEALASAPERVANITEGIDRVARIIQDMRKLSRQDSKKMALSQLNEHIESVLNIARSRLKGNIELEAELTELPLIPCNASQIGQVILNILINAIQALGDKPHGKITLIEQLSQHWLSIEVCDNGPGMNESTLSRVFEPFFTTKAEGEGTGMGLALCYQLIEAHHGRIEVESQLDEGTCFTVWLPLDPGRVQE
ncbi:MAG: hypothetical protein CMI02_03555 [Oceanospirillaceae bacterium]|nr:hypothetical protein [Oceanospirillaceae bacterium]MBT11094.1 hypothetical protein [Oceanospirillaceae bacterium]